MFFLLNGCMVPCATSQTVTLSHYADNSLGYLLSGFFFFPGNIYWKVRSCGFRSNDWHDQVKVNTRVSDNVNYQQDKGFVSILLSHRFIWRFTSIVLLVSCDLVCPFTLHSRGGQIPPNIDNTPILILVWDRWRDCSFSSTSMFSGCQLAPVSLKSRHVSANTAAFTSCIARSALLCSVVVPSHDSAARQQSETQRLMRSAIMAEGVQFLRFTPVNEEISVCKMWYTLLATPLTCRNVKKKPQQRILSFK